MTIKKQEYFVESGNRYHFDWKLKGYSQVDTNQDAWYYGHWANPFKFRLIGYVEGDVSIQTAPNKEEFIDLMRSTAKWFKDNDDELKIDCLLNEKTEQAWKDLGLADLLH